MIITDSAMREDVYHNGVVFRICDLACDSLVDTDSLAYLVVGQGMDTHEAIKYLKGGKSYREFIKIRTKSSKAKKGSATNKARSENEETGSFYAGRQVNDNQRYVQRVRHKLLDNMESYLSPRLVA